MLRYLAHILNIVNAAGVMLKTLLALYDHGDSPTAKQPPTNHQPPADGTAAAAAKRKP